MPCITNRQVRINLNAMPLDYANRLAQQLMADADHDPLVVDVPNDGFHLQVAKALEQMGYQVEIEEFRPRLRISGKGSATSEDSVGNNLIP